MKLLILSRFHPTLQWVNGYLSMLGLKLIHASNWSPDLYWCISDLILSFRTGACEAGQYLNKQNMTCAMCPYNEYQDQRKQEACIPCPFGTYTPMKGSTGCLGKYRGSHDGGKGCLGNFEGPMIDNKGCLSSESCLGMYGASRDWWQSLSRQVRRSHGGCLSQNECPVMGSSKG